MMISKSLNVCMESDIRQRGKQSELFQATRMIEMRGEEDMASLYAPKYALKSKYYQHYSGVQATGCDTAFILTNGVRHKDLDDGILFHSMYLSSTVVQQNGF